MRNQYGEPIEDKLSEAPVVFRKIVDLRFRRNRRLAEARGCAVQVGRTIDLEREVDVSVTRIDVFHADEPQRVGGKVPILV